MEPTDQLEILHVSDLHISTKDTFGRETVLGALVDRVKKDRKQGSSTRNCRGDRGYR